MSDAAGMSRSSVRLALAVIALLACAAYGASVRNGFVWDDDTFIVRNPSVRDLSLWPQYFTRAGTVAADADPTFLRFYRPLQTLSFALDAALWGDRAGGFHLTSLLLHVAASWAVVFAFGPLVGRRAAARAGVLFAVHPALSESVLSLAARGNQLYTLFALLSIGWFVRVGSPFDRRHVLSVAAALCSFFSKEPAIVLVLLMPLLDLSFKPRGRTLDRAAVLIHLPYLLAAALFLAARAAVVETASAFPYWGGSLGQTVLMQANAFVTYMRLLVWPFPLRGRYPAPYEDPFAWLHLLVNIAAVIFAAVLARRGGRGRMAAVAVAWFYLSLAPVSNIIPIPGSMMGERFLYFTFAGVFPLLAAALPDPLPRRVVRPAAAGALCLLIAFVAMDIDRTTDWRDNGRFFSVLAEQEPGDPLIQTLTARQDVLSGNPGFAVRRMAPVMGSLSAAAPRETVASHYWYGRALLDTGRSREAFEQFASIARLTTSVPPDIMLFLVESAARSGNLGFARSLAVRELERKPDDDVLWNSLGNVLGMSGDPRGAAAAYRRAVAINPNNREAAVNLLRTREAAGASP